jgi:hypothetical protein
MSAQEKQDNHMKELRMTIVFFFDEVNTNEKVSRLTEILGLNPSVIHKTYNLYKLKPEGSQNS